MSFLNEIGIISCWLIWNKFLSFMSISVVKGTWNNSKLIVFRYFYFIFIYFFSSLIEPFILHVILWVRIWEGLCWAVCLPGFTWCREVQMIHFQRGIFAHVTDVSVLLGFSCCPPGASDSRLLGPLKCYYFNRELTFSYFANVKVMASIYWELIYARLYANTFHIHCLILSSKQPKGSW